MEFMFLKQFWNSHSDKHPSQFILSDYTILEHHTSPDRHGHQYVVQGRPSCQSHHPCDSCSTFRSLVSRGHIIYICQARHHTLCDLLLCHARPYHIHMPALLHPPLVNEKMFDTRVTRDASIMQNFPGGAHQGKDTMLVLVRDHPIMLPSYILHISKKGCNSKSYML